MATYYIAPDGNDSSGNGTSGSPWKTLNKAVDTVPAGVAGNPNVIICKNGVYNCVSSGVLNRLLRINKKWLTIRAETMRQAIFRDNFTVAQSIPYVEDKANLIFVAPEATGITIDGLQIERFCGAAIRAGDVGGVPHNLTIQNCLTYWTRAQGINVYASNTEDTSKYGQNIIVRNNLVSCASIVSLMPDNPNTHAVDPATGAIRVGTALSALIENNIVDHSFGEGYDIGKFLRGTADNPIIVRGNIARNCHHTQIYVLHGSHVYLYNNISYATQGSPAVDLHSPFEPGNAYKVLDEKAAEFTGSDHIYFWNNLGVNCDALFHIGQRAGVATRSAYCGFNTFVGGHYTFKFMITSQTNASGIIENNIIDDVNASKGGDYKLANIARGIIRENAWSAQPSAPWRDPNSVVTPELGMLNPHKDLRTTGWVWADTYAAFAASVSDNFNVADYHIAASSPVRSRAGARENGDGVTVPLMPFQQDYRGAARAEPDMGFHEASGQIVVNVEADFTAAPSGTALDTGTSVAFTNTSVVTGTTVSGYTWTVKRGTVTQATATTTDYAYTFPQAGSYTVALQVQTPEGNDTYTVAYTITDPTGTPTVDAVALHTPSGLTHPAGATITFTDASTFTLCSFSSRLWEVRTSPGGVLVDSSTAATWDYQFNTAGTFTVKLTENATGGLSDTQTLTYTITTAAPTVTADFTASDGDLFIYDGDEIEFTNTSSVSGTTITAYTWSVSRQGGSGTSETFTTEDMAYTFLGEGLWDVLLRVDTAAGISDLKAVVVTVRPTGGGGTDFAAAPKLFALNTSTGVQTVTAAALGDLVPKGVHLKVVGATTVGTAANGALWSEGAAATGVQWAHARFSANGEGTSVAKRARSSGDLFLTLDGTSITGRGSFVRFVPGGMEIDITDAPPAAYLAEATFYAGETCEFRAGEVVAGAVDTDTRVDTGIDADALYMASTWATDAEVVEADAEMSRGWATRDLAQMHLRNEDRDAQTTATVITRHLVGRIGSSADGVPGFTTIQVTAMDAGGFTVRSKGSSLWRPAGWFAFATGGPVARLSNETLLTSSPSDHLLPFDAQTVMALTATIRTNDSQLGGIDATGQGWWVASIHDSVSQSLSFAQADDADTSSTRSLSAAGFRAVNHDGANLYNSTAVLSATGVSLPWTAAPAWGYKFILLALEKGTDIPDTTLPQARFEAAFDTHPRSGRIAAQFDSSTSSGNGEEIISWLWDFGDGNTSTEANPYHLYEVAGAYDVTLTVTTVEGSDTITKPALVVVAPQSGVDHVITFSLPLASGGPAGNFVDENYDHGHDVELNPAGKFRALTGDDVAAFLALPANELYAQVAYDQDGHRFLIKETDGTMRVVGTTAL